VTPAGRPRLVAILGATAAGKSALGIALARQVGGEVVACDSTAVFRGIDIGTDKVPPDEQQGVPHHLIDVAEPTEVYSAARYAQDQQLDNPNGGNQVDPAIQFDSKGVEFGPWLRRFVAQVKRNWFVPYAAMSLKGHVVITFNVHKDGRISDLQVLRPSDVAAFNNAALNALATSNPTMALPPEYPSDKAFFTVTFYYNEAPR